MFKDERELWYEFQNFIWKLRVDGLYYFRLYRHQLINFLDPMPRARGGESTINYLMRIDPKYSLRLIDYELEQGKHYSVTLYTELLKIANKKNREMVNSLRRSLYHAKYLDKLRALRGLIESG